MPIDTLRSFALSLPDVTEDLPFGPDTLAFRVNGKIFMLLAMDEVPVRFNVKAEPEKALMQREEYEDILPGYHMNKKHWNTVVTGGGVPLRVMKELIEDSYHLVAKTKKTSRK